MKSRSISKAPREERAAIVRASDLSKRYGRREETAVTALDHVSAGFGYGEFTSIMGPSGSGKSTLLHLLAGLDRPSSGSVFIEDTDLAGLPEAKLTTLRRDRLGFVFQAFNLIPTLTAAENITLGERIGGPKLDGAWTSHLIDVLRLGDRLTHRPGELSGGEQQRVAVARALAHRPAVVFADEPTGNLDSQTGGEVLEFLRLAVERFEQTVVMVTHDPAVAARTHRVVFLHDGRIVDETRAPSVEGILSRIAGTEPA